MYRTHTCGALRVQDAGKTVTVAGWVQTIRKFGAITFVDLRDRYGITQLLFGEELNKLLEENPLGREFVLQATGKVIKTPTSLPVKLNCWYLNSGCSTNRLYLPLQSRMIPMAETTFA